MKPQFLYAFLFIILYLFQVLVFNNFDFLGNINPQVHILFILVLPSIKIEFLFLLAFLMGIMIDAFSGTGGIHSSSLLFIAALRTPLFRLINNSKAIDNEYDLRHINVFNRFLFFAVLCTIHNFLIHTFDVFNFKNILDMMINSLASAFLTWVFVVLIFPWIHLTTINK